jgi:plasmid stabilization system protein ParE
MIVRWSPEAAADFAAIVEYIRKQNPSAAERVARAIFGHCLTGRVSTVRGSIRF